MDKHLNILYIHGHGSTGNSHTAKALQQCCGSLATVHHPLFDNNIEAFSRMLANIEAASSFIAALHIDIVVGSSMGGFVAHCLKGIPKILINPCLKPSEQIPLRIVPGMDAAETEKYRQYESSIAIDNSEKSSTIGVFADHDELFSYKLLFENLYGTDLSFEMNSGHRISGENVRNVILPMIHRLSSSLYSHPLH